MHKYSVVCIRTFLAVLDVYWTNGRRGYHIIKKECVVPEIIIPRSPYNPLTCHMYNYNCSFPSCIAHAASHIPSTSSSSPQHRPGHPAVNLNSSLLTHSSSSDNLPAFPRDVHLPTVPQIIRLLPYLLCIHMFPLSWSLSTPEVEGLDQLDELGPELIKCGICCCFCRINWVGDICGLWSVRRGRSDSSGRRGGRGRGRSRNHNVRTLI